MTKARLLPVGLHDGGRIVMRASGPEEAIPFDGLGGFLCLKPERAESETADVELVLPDRMPEERHTLKTTSLTEIAYAADWSRVLIAGWKKSPRRPRPYECYVWQTALTHAGMSAILRGAKAVLAHCAVLLFGESGMGKSTASARWRANGGKCVSDDMALLDFSGRDGEVSLCGGCRPGAPAAREKTNGTTRPARNCLSPECLRWGAAKADATRSSG